MNDAYLHSLLGEREKIIFVTRQHWFLLAEALFLESLLVIGIIALTTLTLTIWLPVPWVALFYLLLLLPLASMLRDILIWANRKYVVTTRRVIQIAGVINKNVIDSSLEKVNDIKLEQPFFGRVFNFGDVEILTASEMGSNIFTRIEDPIRFKTVMLNAKERLERGGITNGDSPNWGSDVSSLIQQLDHLRQQGLLTETEFLAKKTELLKRL